MIKESTYLLIVVLLICLFDIAYVYNYKYEYFAYLEKAALLLGAFFLIVYFYAIRRVVFSEIRIIALCFLLSMFFVFDINNKYVSYDLVTLVSNKYAMPLFLIGLSFFFGFRGVRIQDNSVVVVVLLGVSYIVLVHLMRADSSINVQKYVLHLALTYVVIFELSNKYKLFKLIAVFCGLIAAYIHLLNYNRAHFIFFVIICCLIVLTYLYKRKKIYSLLFVFICAVIVAYAYGFEDVLYDDSLYLKNNRGFLYEEFFDDLNRDELIFGRGPLGVYYSAYFDRINYGDYFNRFSLEVGVLSLLLKGGIIYLLFFVGMGFTAIYKTRNIRDSVVFSRNGFILAFIVLQLSVSYVGYGIMSFLYWYFIGRNISAALINKK